MPQTGLSQLVADPELAAIQRRREMIAQLLRGNQVQDFRSPMSPLAPMANALAMALSNHYGQREEQQLQENRQNEVIKYDAQNPSLISSILRNQTPAQPAAPSQPMPPRGGPIAPIASTDMPQEAQTFLNAVAAPESGGRYDVRWGGPQGPQTFTDMSRHPGIMAPGPQGPSSAAGRYQFVRSTWEPLAQRYGATDFSPQTQDRVAWSWANDEYRNSTGRDLAADIRDPARHADIQRVMSRSSMWTTFNAGRMQAPQGEGPQAIPAQAPVPGGAQALGAPATGAQQPPSPAVGQGGLGGMSPDQMRTAALAQIERANRIISTTQNPQMRARAQRDLQEAQTIMQLAQRETPRLATAAPGATIFNPTTGQPVGQVPREPREWQELSTEIQRIQQRIDSGQATPTERRLLPRLEERLAGLTTPAGEGAFQRETGQRAAARVDTMLEGANTARERVMSGQRILQLLGSGVITGTGAGARESIERAFVTAGLVDGRRVANTGQLMAELAQSTLEASGQLRGPTSDRDIMFLREVAAGRIDLTPDTIRQVVQTSIDRAQRDITRWNGVAQSIQGDQSIPPQVRHMYRPIEIPTVDAQPAPEPRRAPAPQGQPGPGGMGTAEPPGGPAPVRVRTPEEARRLPSGTRIILPDGRPGVVP